MEAGRQPDQQRDHHDVHGAGDVQRGGYAETFWHGVESGSAIEIQVLAGVEDVEAGDPQRDGGAKGSACASRDGRNGDPGRRRRHAQTNIPA